MSSVDKTSNDKTEISNLFNEIDKKLEMASIDKAELERKLKENEQQIIQLTEEKEAMQLKFNQDFTNKKRHQNDSNNQDEKNSYSAKEIIQNIKQQMIEENVNNTSYHSISTMNTTVNSGKEDDKNPSNSSSQSNSNASQIMVFEEEEIQVEEEEEEVEGEEVEEEEVIEFPNSEIFKSFDTLKYFFEETQNVDSYGIEVQDLNVEVKDSDDEEVPQQKVACIKMYIFRIGRYIDFYDKQIEEAFYQRDFEIQTPDQYHSARIDLFDKLVTRSKVLELYDRCGQKAGKYFEQIKGVSLLQIWSNNKHFNIDVVLTLFCFQNCATWSYERVKAVCEFWQSGVVSRYGPVIKSSLDLFDKIYYGFLNYIEKNVQLDDIQRETLRSILNLGKDYCNK